MNRHTHLLCLSLFIVLPLFLFAQPKCFFQHYGTENGLPQNTIMSIIQDKKGYIWVSTWDGLCKFDGYNFFSYKLKPHNTHKVRSSRIDFIREDKYGYIWTIPYDKEPLRFDPRTEKFTGLNIHPEFQKKTSPTEKIVLTNSGKVWLILANDGCVCVKDSLFNIEIYNKQNKKIQANKVNGLYEDQALNSWILSDNGLYKVDASGTVKPYFTADAKSTGHKFFSQLETEGDIWFGADNGSIQIYNKRRKRFQSFDSGMNTNIKFIQRINNNLILIASADQGFAIYNMASKRLAHYSTANLPEMKSNKIFSCYIDKLENIWLELDCIGVSKFCLSNQTMKHFEMKIENKSLNIFPPNFFIFEDNAARLWVHPRGGGFAYYDAVADKLMPFFNEPFSPAWQFSNMMHTAFSDKQGNLWLSTRSHGLEKAVFTNDIFKTAIVDPKIHSSINNDIKAILEDRTKKLWVSSKGGKIYAYQNGKQLGYLSSDGTLSQGKPMEGFCYCIMEDRSGNLWIGTKGNGIYKLTPKGPLKYQIQNYRNTPNDPYSLNNNNIYSIFEDNRGRIWVGTYGGGLNLMYPKQDAKFYHAGNLMKQYPIQSGAQVRIISADKYRNICIGTTQGLIVLPSDFEAPSSIKFSTYKSLFPKGSEMNGNDIHDICTTRKGDTYIAIFGGGVSKIAETDKKGLPVRFDNYNKNNGLPSDISLSIQEDLDEKLWIITEGNLTSFNPKNKSFETYSEVSRLIQGYNFSEGARFSSPSGTIYFGFSNGFLSVRTDQIEENTFIPYIAFTQLRIDNKIVPIGENSPLKQAIDDINILELNHKQNSFTIEFAALDYVNPNNISYAYKLDGIDKDWVVNSKQHQVTYAKIAAGKYVFHLKSTNSDGIWANNERTLTVIVHPPFWASTIAYILYFIVFCGILYAVLRTIFTFYRLQDKMKLEHEQTEMRTRFFTDISHEIRTPLTMIVSPIESMVEDKNTPSAIKEQLQLVSKNANRMLRMVNQILDFRKIQKQVLNVQKTKIGRFVSDVCSNFEEAAEEKNISLHLSSKVGEEVLWIDRDGVEKLLFNLLSNAIKYTPRGKSIYVDIDSKDNLVILSVTDEGAGMTKEIQGKAFTRFASFNKDKSKPSTGIGLSIVKEVADKHKAKIQINSEAGKGTSLSISFNKGIHHFDSSTLLAEHTEEVSETKEPPIAGSESLAQEKKKERKQQSILVVEDDADLRSFIKSSLSEFYQIYEAENGKEAYEIASAKYPDFIISDVMMPEINGFELLQMIRKNRETSHVPFILLTAKTDIESKLLGLEYGADDYLPKPFSVKYLHARIENIMLIRHNLFRLYQSGEVASIKSQPNTEAESGERLITPQDEEFIAKVKAFVIQNIDNSNFIVEDVATEMCMSRTVFFKKLKSLTGLAPIELIREIKIRHAAEMIAKESYSIKEVAFQIGFSDTKYFTQCFKQIFGCTPSEFRKASAEKGQNTSDSAQ